jgi:OFA family oxalate/formate antiporter-like MFS transporter
MLLTLPLGFLLRNPPAGYAPKGYSPVKASGGREAADDAITAWECVRSGRFWMMWAVFFANITAGIAIIGFQSPLFQDLWRASNATLSGKTLAGYGATLIAVTALFNGLGRFFWGSLSDRIGRRMTFTVMLGSQIGIFVALAYVSSPWIFAALLCYILLCYGGGFGTMPAYVLDVFGAKRMAVVYGAILTAWSAAGIVGPQMVAQIKGHCGAAAGHYTFLASAGFVALGAVLSLFARDNARPSSASA